MDPRDVNLEETPMIPRIHLPMPCLGFWEHGVPEPWIEVNHSYKADTIVRLQKPRIAMR